MDNKEMLGAARGGPDANLMSKSQTLQLIRLVKISSFIWNQPTTKRGTQHCDNAVRRALKTMMERNVACGRYQFDQHL